MMRYKGQLDTVETDCDKLLHTLAVMQTIREDAGCRGNNDALQ
jgi:hypothetical protein